MTQDLDKPERARDRTYKMVYPLRVLGMGLGLVLTGSVLMQNAELARFGWVSVLTLVIWPHVAYLHARFSAKPYRAEVANLLVDSAIVGLWVALMQFNLLASVLLVVITTHDKLSTGIRWLWVVSSFVLLAAVGLTVVFVQPGVTLESSQLVVFGALPVLAFHSLAVGFTNYRLIRIVARRNLQLQDLRQRDGQTGLFARAHWQETAQAAMANAKRTGRPTCLLMIDIDHFKPINDSHGHTIGDEVISAVGQAIRDCVRAVDSAGRYGGDEFGVVCIDADEADALAIAERIRSCVSELRLPRLPQVQLSASIGMAPLRPEHATLHDWLNAADAALYQAKSEGRDRVVRDTGISRTAASRGVAAAEPGVAAIAIVE